MTHGSAGSPEDRGRLHGRPENPRVIGLVTRSIEIRLLDTALALSSRLFVAVIPLALFLSAVLPAEQTFADRVVSALDLSGTGRAAAESLFATPSAVKAGMTAVTLLVILYSLVSCAGVLQRAYQAVWRRELGPAGGWRRELGCRVLWAFALAIYVGAIIALADASLPALLDLASSALRVVVAVAFFAWTPYLLLDRRVSARRLLPTAILGAAALATVTLVAPIYMPGFATASATSYGLVGFAFTFLTWLFTQSFLILAAAVLGAELASPPDATSGNRLPQPMIGV